MDVRMFDAVRKMIDHPEQIEDVMCARVEYYFAFKGFVFSIFRRSEADESHGVHTLYLFPHWKGPIEELPAAYNDGLPGSEYARLHDAQAPAGHATTLAELFDTLEMKYMKIDEMIATIMSDD